MAKRKKARKGARRAEGTHGAEHHHAGGGEDAPVLAAGSEPSARGGRPDGRPDGQRLWDMPYSSPDPRLINQEVGLHHLVSRVGHNAAYVINLTLLDAPDHRLIRSGVLLAHRIVEGRGEWYLGAPDWVPLLPKERIDPMSQGDLPEELADLIRPFRRRGTLGPVAAIQCDRREFALRDEAGTNLALLRDDKVTVRRGGLTTARYREVMMTPIGPFSEEQDAWVAHAFRSSGATEVAKFPRLVTRLGAPSNGPTDFPLPPPLNAEGSFAAFVSTLLIGGVRDLLHADLRVRADDVTGPAALAEAAQTLRRTFGGLAPVLDPGWIEDLDEELRWLAELAAADEARRLQEAFPTAASEPPATRDAAPSELRQRLRGERYLTLLERLVSAARIPKVGVDGQRPVREVLADLIEVAAHRLVRAADQVGVESTAPAGQAAQTALTELLQVCDVIEALESGRFGLLRERLRVVSQLLDETGHQDHLAELTRLSVADVSPEEAFELGRRYEHELLESTASRGAFAKHWAKTRKRLPELLIGEQG